MNNKLKALYNSLSKRARMNYNFNMNIQRQICLFIDIWKWDLKKILSFVKNNKEFMIEYIKVSYIPISHTADEICYILKHPKWYSYKDFQWCKDISNLNALLKIIQNKPNNIKKIKIVMEISAPIKEYKESPVKYPYKEKFKSDCKNPSCFEQYWPNWCWWSMLWSLKMKLDPKYKWYWFHTNKRKKEIDYKEVKIDWKDYITFFAWNDKLDFLTDENILKKYKLPKPLANNKWFYIWSDNMWNPVYLFKKEDWKKVIEKLRKLWWRIYKEK